MITNLATRGKGVGSKINSLSSSPTPFSPELTEPQALTDLRRYPWGLGGFGSLNHGTWPFRRVSGTQNLGLQTLRVQTESLCLKSAWHRATEKVFQLQSQLTGETRNFALEQEVTQTPKVCKMIALNHNNSHKRSLFYTLLVSR